MFKLNDISIRKKLFVSFLLIAILSASIVLVECTKDISLTLLDYSLILGCVLIIGAALSFILSGFVLGNLKKLQNAAKEISEGNFNGQFDIDSKDEIGQLAQAFNRIAAELTNTATSMQELDGEISEREDAERKLLRLNEDLCSVVDRLDESNREMKHLTYVASHDLSEPLRKICCFGRLLNESAQDKLDDDERENLWFIVDAADRMLERMDGIRAYSDIIGQAYPASSVDLKKIIDELTDTDFSAVIKSRDALITICEPLPMVNASYSQTKMLLRHLISNALEYHRPNSRPVVSIRAGEKREGMVRIEIEDNGIGITKEDFEIIFAMFKRLHPRRKHKGAGMGLSLCKKIVERHEGHIGVTSEYGRGSTFWFTLPLANPQYAEPDNPQKATAAETD